MAKKNFRKDRNMKELKAYVSDNEKLSMRKQCELLGINRSSFYYQPNGESSENLQLLLPITPVRIPPVFFALLKMHFQAN